MHTPKSSPLTRDPLGGLAGDVASDLYFAVCGHRPKTVRAYHDDDALLLLMRFDPAEVVDAAAEPPQTVFETAFMAMPGMIASAVEARSGQRLAPGNLSVCAERGLAVFAFNSAVVEEPADADAGSADDLFSLDAMMASAEPVRASVNLAG